MSNISSLKARTSKSIVLSKKWINIAQKGKKLLKSHCRRVILHFKNIRNMKKNRFCPFLNTDFPNI